jgi:hypothetical protein
MDADFVLSTFEQNGVDFILIGGMNFLLRHQPVLTFDIDLWVRDEETNLRAVSQALVNLGAEWGRDEASWAPVSEDMGWLLTQSVFCLTTRYGALDIFRSVRGLENQYESCRARSTREKTRTGVSFQSLSDQDMLACQLALPEQERRLDRTAYLQGLIEKGGSS